ADKVVALAVQGSHDVGRSRSGVPGDDTITGDHLERAAGVVENAAAGDGGVATDRAVIQRERVARIKVFVGQSAAVVGGGVAADGAVGQRGGAGPGVAATGPQAAAVAGGAVAADGAVGEGGHYIEECQAAAAPVVGVAADGAVSHREAAAFHGFQAA